MLPIYNIKIDLTDNETGVYTVSLVESPAVEVDFLTFSKEEPIQLQFNDEKYVITGVALRADHPIYRNSVNYGEHYVVFNKETIRQIVEKYSKFGFNNLVNIEHDQNHYVDNIIMLESYIVDKERGLNPIEFDVSDGSWIVSYKVNDITLWDKIKKGEVKGFSVEGLFRYSEPESVDFHAEKPVDNTILLNDLDRFIENLLED